MPAEVRWFSIIGFLWGRPWPHFTVGLAGLVGFWGTSGVGRGASSLFSLSSSAGASSLSSLIL